MIALPIVIPLQYRHGPEAIAARALSLPSQRRSTSIAAVDCARPPPSRGSRNLNDRLFRAPATRLTANLRGLSYGLIHRRAERRMSREHNMEEMEQVISLRAYALWEAEGRPDGRALNHWLAAEQECRTPVAGGTPAAPAASRAAVKRSGRARK
jgi:hypothetical protein